MADGTWAAAWPAVAHVLLDELPDTAHVTGDDGRHLARVRRLRTGERVTAADGRGTWRPYEITRVEAAELVLAAAGEPRLEPVLKPDLTVAFALTKGSKPDVVVRQLTELGVDRIVPFRSRRSVAARGTDRLEVAQDRLHRVAREAAMQCRRARVPEIEALQGLQSLAGRPGLVVADRAGDPPEALATPDGTGWTLLVGPEGGFEDAEIRELGPVARLAVGPHVLRAETAAVAAAAALSGSRRPQGWARGQKRGRIAHGG